MLVTLAAWSVCPARATAQPASAGDPKASPYVQRPKVGLALGGGSARGIAHVGVLRWFDEHHIPVDVLAGTSMGGLIGGSFASGMSPDEIETMLSSINWDAMFGSSNFAFKNVRRKWDSRAYPSHLEFGLKRGIVPPASLNTGQQVDLLLARIAASSYALTSFDQLPTPFRAVAVDLKTAKFVVLDRGSLALAMRATMSLPLIFPPIELDGRVLVDGGAMNNIPADVVRSMGADRVIAINVGDLSDRTEIDYTMFGLAGGTLDAMMRANTLKALESADLVMNVPLSSYGSLDWRRYRALIEEGYKAADAMKDQLLPLAATDTEWDAWKAQRAARTITTLPTPASLTVDGVGKADDRVMRQTLAKHVGHPVDVPAIDKDITELGGLDRYQTIRWQVVPDQGGDRLEVRAESKRYGPPFVYLGMSLENTTTNDVKFSLSGRYLAFDVLGSGSELRIDATAGTDPSLAVALYRPIGSSPFFIEPFAAARNKVLSLIRDDEIIATYNQRRTAVGADVGFNVGRLDDVRFRAMTGRLSASVGVGDPGLPDVSGAESIGEIRWRHDGQDSVVVPSRGIRSTAYVQHYFDAPTPPEDYVTDRVSDGITKAEVTVSSFWSIGNVRRRNRVFVTGGLGTSFDGHPLPTEQFAVGGPFRLGAFDIGEQRGDHYMVATAGYLRQIGRLPDFLGGPAFVGAWMDSGSAFDEWKDMDYAVQTSAGVVVDTLLGPAFVATSVGFDGE
ncbi:MAG TPA: patatin-like phospholipase family protein, partial [Ilumatobacteraceae bacterium]|nr:patatin-like phospholipase family protein [Ilumatobacteraceae bacterium]